MEIAKIVLEYIKSLIWPSLAILVIILFRDSLKAILTRLRGADLPGGVSLDFEQEIRDAKQLSREVKSGPQPKESQGVPSIPLTEANARMLNLGLQPSPSGLDFEYYRNLGEDDPNIALAGLRMEIEVLVRNLAQGFKVDIQPRHSASNILRKLYEKNAITIEQFQLAQKIVQLCNAAVHGTKVSREEAELVIDVAKVLAEQYIAWLSWGFPDDWKPTNRAQD